MLSIREQIERGILVCPRTQHRLVYDGNTLRVEGTELAYSLLGPVPFLCSDPTRLQNYLEEDAGRMLRKYTAGNGAVATPKSILEKLERWAARAERTSYRAESALAAWERVAQIQERPQAICLSIGGGPERHGGFVNVNIGPFPNVDVVADAYELPYSNNSVDAICCAAVLEHLEFPDRAVAEAVRVLKPGGEAYFETPFSQPYHGYPNHFQNFTLTGHERLLQRHGLEIVSSGVGVGPSHTLYHILTSWLLLFTRSKLLRLCLSGTFAKVMRPRDKILNLSSDAHVLASTTYVHARKPVS